MKAISLWQPWASLIALGYKRFETRSWQTTYRGPLVIHAAKRTDDLEYWFNQEPFRACLLQSGCQHFVDLPLGKALCIVQLTDIQPTEAIRHKLGKNEHAFGDYEDGRFAWHLQFVERFCEPIRMRGAQGLFDCVLPTALDNQETNHATE